jgi:hypothetical protein
MVGSTYLIYPWLMPTVRFESLDYDQDFANDVENWTFSLTAAQYANVRWTAEYLLYPEDTDGNDTFKLNMQYAF